jgi:uncharacterized membrane protein
VNDPYTAVQAIDHLSVLVYALARRPVGAYSLRAGAGTAMVVVPGHTFADYLRLASAQIRRYGSKEPAVARALLRMLQTTASAAGDDPERRAAIHRHASLVLADAEREIAQPADLEAVRADAERLLQAVRQ